MNNSLKLTNEIEVGSSPDGSFRLTNLRVQHYKSSLGTETFISIMLEKISSVATVYTSYILYLVIGILLEAIGVMLLASSSRSENNGAVGPIVFGLIFIIVFFLTRKRRLVVASDGGGVISVITKGMHVDAVNGLLNDIEQAKDIRVRELSLK